MGWTVAMTKAALADIGAVEVRFDDGAAGALFDRSGNGGPAIWANGKIIGAWAQRSDGQIVRHLFDSVDRATQRTLDTAADQLMGVLCETRFKVRFPPPIQQTLLTQAG